MSLPAAVYRPRKPQESDYYRCVEDCFEALVQIYDEHFSRQYGYWRPYLENVIHRYLDCGDPHNGFARVKCKGCGHEYLLSFSCKRRHFCPSCHQKRVVEFGELLCAEVLKKVPHRHFVFSIPKLVRKCFLYDRSLLTDLSRCAWESLKVIYQDAVPQDDSVPGAVIAVQTFGDFLGFNPHCHVLVTDGCFYGDRGMFRVAPPIELKKVERIFRHKTLKMLLAKGKITQETIALLSTWRHSGFNVFCGKRISPHDATALENLARYIIRASFSQERMTYLPQEGKVLYASKQDKQTKVFPALEWMAAMCSHIPNKGEQMVRYYGYYSNVCRGKRQKAGTDAAAPCILEVRGDVKAFRRSWARLIQKIYEVDPLVCPKCQGPMRIISFIEDREVVQAILKHLGIWLVRSRPPPKVSAPLFACTNEAWQQATEPAGSSEANCHCQVPANEDYLYCDPQYSWDDYVQSTP